MSPCLRYFSCCLLQSSFKQSFVLNSPYLFFPLQLLDVDQNFNNQFAFAFVLAGSVHWWLCSQAFCLRGVIFCILSFLLVDQDLFCRFYLPGAISVQHALSSSTRKRENGGGYENNFTFSVSVFNLSLTRLVIYMRPGLVMDVLRISAQRFFTFPNLSPAQLFLAIQRMAKWGC